MLSLRSLLTLAQVGQALGHAKAPEELLGKGVRFVERIYRLRMIGLSIGFFCVAAAFLQNPVPWPLWVLLCFHGYLWPHVAYLMALKNSSPYHAERRNLVADTIFGGFWVIAMQGNLVPSTLILAMLLMDNIAAGGLKLLLRGLIGGVVGALLGLLLLDFHFQPLSNLHTIIACMPMLVLYPLVLGKSTYDMSKKLAERSRAFETVSQRDGLTGLLNRRYWESLLIEEFEVCHRQQRHSCLLLLDLDHFKNINDKYGHLIGDEVLKNFSLMLQQHLRAEDLIGRYGGEEFVAILRNVEINEAISITERLLHQVRLCRAQENSLWGCTVSAGLVPFQPDMEAHYSWLQRADNAMYKAKDHGRNCLFVDAPSILLHASATSNKERRVDMEVAKAQL